MEEMSAAVNAATTPQIQMWMNWILAVFALSIIFVWKYKGARWVLASLVLSIPASLLLFQATKDPWLLGIVHIALWVPLLAYLLLVEFKREEVRPASIYGVWLIALIITMIVSLIFDVRDVYQVLSSR